MYRKIINKLKDKNIAILGFGKEGKSTYNFIRKYLVNKHLTILDIKDIDIIDSNVTLITGKNYLDNLNNFDLIIKSPGITLKDIDISTFEDKITSQLELLLELFKENIIGITGTKGKSTTSSLMYSVLKDQKKDTYLLGNIGTPVFDKIVDLKEDTILVIEMSSHQLEFIRNSPHIAIILNLYQDHLDHAGSVEHYHANKMNIFKYQNKNDYALYSSDNIYLSKLIKDYNYQAIKYDISLEEIKTSNNSVRLIDNNVYIDNELIYEDKKRNLIGIHNLKNIMFVLTVSKILNLDMEKVTNTIRNFKGLKYRLEFIGKFNDISYYNDTIATIPEATISAINSLSNVDTLIFGGLDRNIDYKEFIDFLECSNITNLICMPTTGIKIGHILKEKTNKNIYFVNTLEEAYKIAEKSTKKGCSCLLSPAAASYEFFKNFEEKGKCFEDIVMNANKN